MGRGNKSSDQCLKISICLNIGVNHLNCLECSQVDIIFQMHFIVNILNNVVIEIWTTFVSLGSQIRTKEWVCRSIWWRMSTIWLIWLSSSLSTRDAIYFNRSTKPPDVTTSSNVNLLSSCLGWANNRCNCLGRFGPRGIFFSYQKIFHKEHYEAFVFVCKFKQFWAFSSEQR